jgi:hypothetical protein
MPQHLEREWMIAQAKLNRPVQMANLAKLEHSTVEKIDGHDAVETKQRGLFVQLDSHSVAALVPPQRRELTRWLRFVRDNKKPVISEYLAKAIRSSKSTHVSAAIDVEDMIDIKAFRAWLLQTQTLGKKRDEIDPVLKLLGTLQGMRFTIHIEDRATPVEVHFDFADRPGVASGWVKPLFLEAVEEMGLGIEEFKQAQSRVAGNTVTVRANLTDSGLAGVLSLILGPTLNRSQNVPVSSGNADPNAVVDATRRYYQAIQKYLADLSTKNKLATNYNTCAGWHDSYAKQIDQLPVVNVDPEAAKYGAEVSRKLRVLAGSLRGVPVQVGTLEGQKRWVLQYNPPVYNYGWGPWGARPFGWGGYGTSFQPGSFQYDDNFAKVRAAQTMAIAKGAQEREKIWMELDDERNKIRSALSQKYKVDFDAPAK